MSAFRRPLNGPTYAPLLTQNVKQRLLREQQLESRRLKSSIRPEKRGGLQRLERSR